MTAARSSAISLATLADDLPLVKRDGGFVRAGAIASARRGPRSARREPPRHRRHAGGLRRGDRRPSAQDQAQQLSRLLHRDAAGAGRGAAQAPVQRALHPSPDDGRRAALHDERPNRSRGEDRVRRRPGARPRTRGLRPAAAGLHRRGRSPARVRRGAGRNRRRRGPRRACGRSGTGRGPSSTPRSPSRSSAGAILSWRPR